MTSLRKRLIWILLAMTLFAWVASALLTGAYATRVMLNQVDRQLEQYADLVNYITQIFARQIDEGLPVYEPWFRHEMNHPELYPMVIDDPANLELSPALNIWLKDDLLAVLEQSPRFEKPVEEGLSFLQTGDDGRRWRVLSRYDERNELWSLVGIELEAARWAMLGILGRALFPLLVIMPLTVVLFYLGVSRGLMPLKRLAGQISRRNPRVLDPVQSVDVPLELQPVVSALNRLLDRLAVAIEGEQRFTANAAHELMTPLAAIKTEVQLCQRQADDKSVATMLERIAVRVDRASHTVAQLLTLARVDPDSPLPETSVQLGSLLGEVLAETAHLAAGRGLEVELSVQNEVDVSGGEEALAILMRNLLINAFRYASDNSVVRVSLSGGTRPVLEICNDCKSLSAEQFSHLQERFYRVPGSKGLGAGLGLSIVARIADMHGARLELCPGGDGSGFRARVHFP